MERFLCPEGCEFFLARRDFPRMPDGIACPHHRLYCGRVGRRKLWPFWAVKPRP